MAAADSSRRLPYAAAVLALMAIGALLRAWGIRQGLPYAYNIDENAHFVPHAIGFFGHGYDPRYFVNPPTYTYVVHVVYWLFYGTGNATGHEFARDPGEVFLVGRIVAAAVNLLAIGLIYMAGAVMFNRRVGLLAAALATTSFLPVFYSHQALADAPELAPVALTLYGCGRLLRRGFRVRDYALAAVGLGLAADTKYLAVIMALPIAGAAFWHWREEAASEGRFGVRSLLASRALRYLLLAAVLSLAVFLIANPYAALDVHRFASALRQQAQLSTSGKLGAATTNGYVYYLGVLTWGMGWVPALAALAGAVLLVVRRDRAWLLLVPATVVYYVAATQQSRYFGRWLLPLFPICFLLAGCAGVAAADALARRRRLLAPALTGVAALALCAQSLVYVIHDDAVLARADTRGLARDWLVRNVAPGTLLAVDPIVPDRWLGDRWRRFTPKPPPRPPTRHGVSAGSLAGEKYVLDLTPALLDRYRAAGACYVVTGSIVYERAFRSAGKALGAFSKKTRSRILNAVAYYRALQRQGRVVFHASPYNAGAKPVTLNFDFSFDYYPLAYHRPGPDVYIYRLSGGRC